MQLVAATMDVGQVLSVITPTRYGTLRVPFAPKKDSVLAERRLITAARSLPVPEVDPQAVPTHADGDVYYQNYFHELSVEEAVSAVFNLNIAAARGAHGKSANLGDGWQLVTAEKSAIDNISTYKDSYVSAIKVRNPDGDRKIETQLDLRAGVASLEAGARGRSLQMVVRFWRDPQADGDEGDVLGCVETGRHKFNIDPANVRHLTGFGTPDEDFVLVASAQMLRLDQFGGKFKSARIVGPQILPSEIYPGHVMSWAAVKALMPDFESPVAREIPLTEAKFVVDPLGRKRLVLYVINPFSGELMPLCDELEAKMLGASGVELAA